MTLRYAATGLAGMAVITAALWPILGEADRQGVIVAGLVALPIQMLAFWLLLRFRNRVNGFFAVWAGGTVVRMLVVAVAAVVVIRADAPGAVAMLLALAGFFFGLLLLEPVYFRIGRGET
ncbi:MAG: hypothetical protein ACE5GJ_02065 [Gemmatimonadota bacterium]